MISSKRSANELPSSVQTALWEGGVIAASPTNEKTEVRAREGNFPNCTAKPRQGSKLWVPCTWFPEPRTYLRWNSLRQLTRGFWHWLKAYIIQHPCAYANSKENFHMVQEQSSQKNHGGLRKRVLPDKHKWNTIPHGCRVQGVFLYAILGLA